MVKLVLNIGSGGKVYVFGLCRMNVRELQRGRPIGIDAKELGLGEGKVLIMYGETEEAILGELRDCGVPLPDGILPQ